jgi:hypothetical protein
MLIPNKHNGYTRDGVRRVFFDGGGGGGGGHTTSTGTTYTSPVPEWLQSEQKDIVARGMALGQQPYQAYTGERISQFTPLQRMAYGAAEQQGVAGQLGAATGLAGLAGMSSFRDPGTAGSFMNPFIEQALTPQLQGLARQAQIEGTRQQGEATQRGAFGGSRDAIMRAEREKNLLSQQADVLNRGYAQAFDTAQQQFNAERAAQLQAAGQLGQLGQQQFGQEMDIMGRQREFGADQQAQIQRILDQQYADFQAQRDFPYQQIGFMSDLIQGRGGSTRQVYPQPGATPVQTLAGLGTAAIGLKGLMAKGGEVQHYADGGITRLLGDDQLQQVQSPMAQIAAQEEMMQRQAIRDQAPASMPRETDMTEAELLQAMQRALQEGSRAKAAVIQEIIEERRMADSGIAMIAPETVGDMPEGGLAEMAGGGMVSFANGGDIILPAGTPRWVAEQERLNNPGRNVRVADEGSKWRDMRPFFTDEVSKERLYGTPRPGAQPTQTGQAQAVLRDSRLQGDIETAAGKRNVQDSVAQVVPESAVRQQAALGIKQLQDDQGGNISTAGGIGGPLTVGGYMSLLKEAGFDPQANRTQLKDLMDQKQAAEREGIQADRAALDEMIRARGIYGEDREKELRGDLEGLAGKKDEAKSMALFQAGLAILSADPSRGALSAIGQGAIQGLGAYKGDIEKLEAKRDKINERVDRILDIRRQESMADDDKRMALRKEENRLKAANINDTYEMYKGFGVEDRALATSVANQVVSSREAAANRAATLDRLSQASKANPTQYRITLSQEIASLEKRKKDGIDWTDQDQKDLEMLQAERRNLAQYLAKSSGINTGQPAGGGGKVDTSNPLLKS